MQALLAIHVVGGSVALLSGAAALSLRKGSRRHGSAGLLFFVSMLIMAGLGAAIAALESERGTALIGIFTCYLVVTSWLAARCRDGRASRLDLAGLVVVLLCAAALFALGSLGMQDPSGRADSLPYAVHFVFGSVAIFAALLDLNFVLRGRLSGIQRIGRHLWRMCTALLIAATSFFQGQQDEFPEAWQGSWIWSVPQYVVLAAMVFWILRVRFSASFRNWPPRRVDMRGDRQLPAGEPAGVKEAT